MIKRPFFGNRDITVEKMSPLIWEARIFEASPVHCYIKFTIQDKVQEISAVDDSILLVTVSWKN